MDIRSKVDKSSASYMMVDEKNRLRVVLVDPATDQAVAPGTSSGGGTNSLTPMIYVPPNTTLAVLKSAGIGGINDTIRAIRVVPTGGGTSTTVRLTDGDGQAYPDPDGTPGLIANPWNNTPVCGDGLTQPLDIPMYDQPSYSGSYKLTTPLHAGAWVYGNFA